MAQALAHFTSISGRATRYAHEGAVPVEVCYRTSDEA